MSNPSIRFRCRNDAFAPGHYLNKHLIHVIRSPEGTILEERNNSAGMVCCTLVIPAYNEAERISLLLREIRSRDIEYIFICDGNDGTASIISLFTKEHQEMSIRCLEYPERLGKGMAIKQGLSLAKTRYAGYMDADGSTTPQQMEALFRELNGSDGIIGSRWVGGAKITTSQGLFRRFESRVFNLVIRMFFNLPYHDTQCGAKVFKKEALDTVLPLVVSKGFEFDVELIWRLRNQGFKIREYPIEWKNVGNSRVKGQDAISMLGNLLYLRFGGERA
jgi:dolichol-phosphate mannosyltransferase